MIFVIPYALLDFVENHWDLMYRFFLQTYAYIIDFFIFLNFQYLFFSQRKKIEKEERRRAAREGN